MFCFIRAALHTIWQRTSLWSANLTVLKKPDPVQSLDPGPQIVLSTQLFLKIRSDTT